jgi:acyl-CoA reductase-like NAD-dependent aldehyde dehydrogenase
MGTLISPDALERIDASVREAVRLGATVLKGGRRHRDGRNYEPTVLANVKPDMAIQCQEIFGPVVTVTPYQTDEEAIRLTNASVYGLRAGVFTRDLKRAFRYARDLEVGGVSINESSRFRLDNTPATGVKNSGVGHEGGRYAYEEFTYQKFVGLNLN